MHAVLYFLHEYAYKTYSLGYSQQSVLHLKTKFKKVKPTNFQVMECCFTLKNTQFKSLCLLCKLLTELQTKTY